MLRSLGEQELQAIIAERGNVEVACEFCSEQYRFDQLDIGGVLAGDSDNGSDASDTVH